MPTPGFTAERRTAPAGPQLGCYHERVVRASAVFSLVILACSGARPAADPEVPIAGLPPAQGSVQADPEDVGASPGARELAPAPRRFETVRLAPAPEPDPLARGPRSLGHRVDLELSRAPIGEAFRFLAEAANVNVVLGDGVEGEVTLRLRRVTVRDALRAVAATHDLRAEWRGNILWVNRP